VTITEVLLPSDADAGFTLHMALVGAPAQLRAMVPERPVSEEAIRE
jgi:hypothetical protein